MSAGAAPGGAAAGVARLWASLAGRVMAPIDRRLPQGADPERGGSTVEFVLLLPAFLVVFISSMEGALLLTRQVMLERAVDIAVREIRLGPGETITQNHVRSRICERARILPECDESLVVELVEIPTTTYAMPAGDVACSDRRASPTIRPDADFLSNRLNRLVLLRACFAVDPMLHESTFAMTRTLASNLVSDEHGAILMLASSAFTVE